MDGPQMTGWQVTTVTPDQQFGQDGRQIPGKQLTISTDTGYTGMLFVPNSVMNNHDVVRQMIEDEVRSVTGLQNLSGKVTGS